MYLMIIMALLYCCSTLCSDNQQQKVSINLKDIYKNYIQKLINNQTISNDTKVNAIMAAVEELCKQKQQIPEQIIAIQAFEIKQKDNTIHRLNKELNDQKNTIQLLMAANTKEKEQKERTQNIVLGAIAIGVSLYILNTFLPQQAFARFTGNKIS